jgi:hypothetical protein
MSCWTSLAWWHRLHNCVDLRQCVILRSEVGSHQRVRAARLYDHATSVVVH